MGVEETEMVGEKSNDSSGDGGGDDDGGGGGFSTPNTHPHKSPTECIKGYSWPCLCFKEATATCICIGFRDKDFGTYRG